MGKNFLLNWTNTLVFYAMEAFTVVKMFVIQVPADYIINSVTAVISSVAW
jgi:hypothetical protein